ncbi:hypothetical protein [Roseateles sp.]|uniref:hypothetical protein n=1 Tax=Roseateles sp. TaxID=1971397 RepID=UPI002F3EF287
MVIDPSDEVGEELRALWNQVLAELRQVGEACAGPEAQRRLRRIGVRRPDVLVAGLAGEYRRTRQMAVMGGCLLNAIDAPFPGGASPADCEGLARGFETLSATYARLFERLAPPQGSHRHTWLESRVRVHLARAEALRLAL